MSINIQALNKKANSLKGCLAHQMTTTGRRRYPDEDGHDEDPLLISNPYIGDEAKLLCSKAHRVLPCKTQVFTLPQSKLTRNRGSHVNEVVAVSVVTSDMLGLNTSFVRAAAIGHDIGHVPLGHQGEAWLAMNIGVNRQGKFFCHEVMGPIIAQKIERCGKGLNLCHETLEAMMRHSGDLAIPEMPPEAWVLRYCDKFAYIFHDINDIERTGYPLPKELMSLANEFGGNQRERTTTAMAGLIIESAELGRVSFEESDIGKKFQFIRKLMYEVYARVTQQNVVDILGPVMDFLKQVNLGDPLFMLALMTDEDVFKIKNHPGMKSAALLNETALKEVIPYLDEIGSIDLCNPDLDW